MNFADKLGIGAGVVAQAFTGNVSEGTIVFDAETDFEEYQICDPGENINSPVFDVSGKEFNKFDAKSYFSKDKDPSRGLVLDYQKKLREADRKPFWSTRMNPPLRVIGEGREDRTKYDVVHKSKFLLAIQKTLKMYSLRSLPQVVTIEVWHLDLPLRMDRISLLSKQMILKKIRKPRALNG